MSDKIGRNDLCFCGSGKKFKKCCIGQEVPEGFRHKDNVVLPLREDIDYGLARVDDDFFERNWPQEVSAARLVYIQMVSPRAMEDVAAGVRQETDRYLGEIEEIRKISGPEEMIGFLKRKPDILNYPLVVQKFQEYEAKITVLLLRELQGKANDAFVEWAVKLLYLSKKDHAGDIIDIIESYQRDPYIVSLLCLLLGFYDHPKIPKLLWDYFYYFKVHFTQETFSEGPLLALYEMDDRLHGELSFRKREGLEDENVEEFTDEGIVQRLKQLGIPVDKETFLKDVHKFISAQDMVEEWIQGDTISIHECDEDFLFLACRELWERWAPGVMFDERLSGMVDEGYDWANEHKDCEACNIWLKVWVHFKARYTEHVHSIEEADKDYRGYQSWYNWCQDFEMHLGNAMRRDHDYIAKAIGFFQDFCGLLPQSNSLIIQNMMMAHADALMLTGDVKAGDALFQEVIDRFPNDVWGYIRWGDVYSPGMNHSAGLSDPVKAEKIYRMALGRGLEDEKEVKYRIEDI